MRSYRIDEILCTQVKTVKWVNEQDANEEIAKRDKRIAELIADYSRTSEAMFSWQNKLSCAQDELIVVKAELDTLKACSVSGMDLTSKIPVGSAKMITNEQLLILVKNGLQPLFKGTLADIAQELLNYREAERASDLNCTTEEFKTSNSKQ